MRSVIYNPNLSITVEVDATVPILVVNNLEYSFSDIREAEFLEQIIKSHPQILTYDSINNLILKKYGIADDEFSDPIHYIRKKKLSLCRLLSQATRVSNNEIIINVRKVGYKFNTGWTLPDNDVMSSQKESHRSSFSSDINDNKILDILADLEKISNILKKTIIIANQLNLCEINDDNGDVLLVLNCQDYEQEIAEISNNFIDASKNLIKHLNLNPFDIQYQYIIHLLEIIYSYVRISRQGKGISETTWRELFTKEIQGHYQNLKNCCLLSTFPTISSIGT